MSSSNKGLKFITYLEFQPKEGNSILKWTEKLNRYFTDTKNIQMDNKHKNVFDIITKQGNEN